MRSLLLLLAVVIVSRISAYAETADSPLPRNISIEVEFKEHSVKTKGVKDLWQYSRTRESQYTKQYIVVSDGLTAYIRVGEDVPYIDYYKVYLTRHGYIETRDVSIREVGTKMAVTPRIRGDFIEITLTPQISYISGSKRGVIDVKELTTSVLAKDGQPLSIGGLVKDRDFAGNFFKTESASNLDIVLTPHIK